MTGEQTSLADCIQDVASRKGRVSLKSRDINEDARNSFTARVPVDRHARPSRFSAHRRCPSSSRRACRTRAAASTQTKCASSAGTTALAGPTHWPLALDASDEDRGYVPPLGVEIRRRNAPPAPRRLLHRPRLARRCPSFSRSPSPTHWHLFFSIPTHPQTLSTLTVFLLTMILHPQLKPSSKPKKNSTASSAKPTSPHSQTEKSSPTSKRSSKKSIGGTPGPSSNSASRTSSRRRTSIADGRYPKALWFLRISKALPATPRSTPPLPPSPPTASSQLFLPPIPPEPKFTDVFGYGRRVCLGRHLADNGIWIAAATILASCKITNALDENGSPVVLLTCPQL
uniref:Cytochrome P450 n=1 Tax=Mycena chlorophos TaxID=658473 RepID=A0ABQ0LEV1_MYCCL|nr:cytochrome P450 [Mycena chlorophos]